MDMENISNLRTSWSHATCKTS